MTDPRPELQPLREHFARLLQPMSAVTLEDIRLVNTPRPKVPVNAEFWDPADEKDDPFTVRTITIELDSLGNHGGHVTFKLSKNLAFMVTIAGLFQAIAESAEANE